VCVGVPVWLARIASRRCEIRDHTVCYLPEYVTSVTRVIQSCHKRM
jgi:hypothetical protein